MEQLPSEILDEYDEHWQVLDMLDWLQDTTAALEIPTLPEVHSSSGKSVEQSHQ